MQISPTSTHSHQLKDPLVDVISYWVVYDVRNTSDSNQFGSLQILSNVAAYEFAHGLSSSKLKTPR